MSAATPVAVFAKNSVEMRLAKASIGLGAGLIFAVLVGNSIRSIGAPESLVITVFGMGALSGFVGTFAILALALVLKIKEDK